MDVLFIDKETETENGVGGRWKRKGNEKSSLSSLTLVNYDLSFIAQLRYQLLQKAGPDPQASYSRITIVFYTHTHH